MLMYPGFVLLGTDVAAWTELALSDEKVWQGSTAEPSPPRWLIPAPSDMATNAFQFLFSQHQQDKTRKWILFMSYWYGLMKENWNENNCASGHTWRSAHGPRRSFSSCSGQPPVAKHRGLAPRGVSTGPNHHHLRIRLLKVGCFSGRENEEWAYNPAHTSLGSWG